MNKEVGWAYGEVWEKRHLLNLPRQFNLKTYPEWEPWLVEAFMNNHDDSPEKSEDLKQLVEEQVNRNCSVKGKEIDGRKLSRSEHDEEIKKGREATPADYCAEIKKSFKKAAKRFANDMSWERGD